MGNHLWNWRRSKHHQSPPQPSSRCDGSRHFIASAIKEPRPMFANSIGGSSFGRGNAQVTLPQGTPSCQLRPCASLRFTQIPLPWVRKIPLQGAMGVHELRLQGGTPEASGLRTSCLALLCPHLECHIRSCRCLFQTHV